METTKELKQEESQDNSKINEMTQEEAMLASEKEKIQMEEKKEEKDIEEKKQETDLIDKEIALKKQNKSLRRVKRFITDSFIRRQPVLPSA